MQKIADHYSFSLERVVAVFVSLSPNSSYHQNLRSCVSVLRGVKEGWRPHDINVATYGHCKDRAWRYALGIVDFWHDAQGPKIKSFYRNILDPRDPEWVTVDGHMSCIWQDKNLTMREALISGKQYRLIRDATIELAGRYQMIPCQMQAVLWFVRKRVSNVVYDPQLKLFADRGDVWNTFVDVSSIKPYRSMQDVREEVAAAGARRQSAVVDAGGASQSAFWSEQELAPGLRKYKAD